MENTSANWMLDCLSPGLQARLLTECQHVDLPITFVLQKAGHTPTHAFFLEEGFASQVISIVGARSVEVGTVGREGVVGARSLLGPAEAITECLMVAPGAGWEVPMDRLRTIFQGSTELRSRLLEFVQAEVVSGSYMAACNKLHAAEPRLARWLLTMGDRQRADVFPLTQSFAGQMLGTRRMTVNLTLGRFELKGLIECARGQVRILNRGGLQAEACECYRHLRRLYSGLYRPLPGAVPAGE